MWTSVDWLCFEIGFFFGSVIGCVWTWNWLFVEMELVVCGNGIGFCGNFFGVLTMHGRGVTP